MTTTFVFKRSITILCFFLLVPCCCLPSPPPPNNDVCEDAIPLTIDGVVKIGSTLDATNTDYIPEVCGMTTVQENDGAKGVWYSVIGNGQSLDVTTCTGEDEAEDVHPHDIFDTQIAVYSGNCSEEEVTCVNGNDDMNDSDGDAVAHCNKKSTVTWSSIDGVEYFIYVFGYENPFGIGKATGEFNIQVKVSAPLVPTNAEECLDVYPCGITSTGRTMHVDILGGMFCWDMCSSFLPLPLLDLLGFACGPCN